MVMFCKLLLNDKDFASPIHPLQILFVRMVITYSFCFLYLVLVEKNPDVPFGPKNLRVLLFIRALGGFISVCGQYWSLLYLNVSDTVIILFLEPTVTAFMAWITLGEMFTKVEAIGGLAAFVGVILVAKPHFLLSFLHIEDPNETVGGNNSRLIGSALALMSCFGTGVAMCALRKIGFQTHPLFTVSVYALLTVIASFLGIIFIPTLTFEVPHTVKQWGFLTTIGVTGFVMQFLFAVSIQHEKASRATAMVYTQLIYASIFDYFINGTFPKGLTLLGEIIILVAVFTIVYFKDSAVVSSTVIVDVENDIPLESYQDDADADLIEDRPNNDFEM